MHASFCHCMQPLFFCMQSVQPKECTQTEFNCITLLFHSFDLLTANILEHSGTFLNSSKHMSDMRRTHVTGLELRLLIPLEILPHFYKKALVCRSSRTRVGNLQKFRTIYYTKMKKRVGHVKYTCHVSGTMSIEFLVKFYPIFM